MDSLLSIAIQAAQEAGAVLREEFNRPGGPRGTSNHAEVDEVAERLIANHLIRAFPEYGFLGEELGLVQSPRGDSGRLWIVDPNDGTSAYMDGFRGSAVSIALLERGEPILGVVYAFNYPDDNGELITWAKGGPVLRNGKLVSRNWPNTPTSDCVVLLSHHADKNPLANARCMEPMRYRSVPSIAYRLALVAVGDGDVAVSLNGPVSWDIAGGHAILLGTGGDVYDQHGTPIRYSENGSCSPCRHIFGGPKALTDCIRQRDWGSVFERHKRSERYSLCWPKRGGGSVDPGMLSRAQGCLLGQLAGDALGSLVEFKSANSIRTDYPDGVKTLANGGTWDTIAGQPTDDSEMALLLARTLVDKGCYDPDVVRDAYQYWLNSGPFDVGGTVSCGLRGELNYDSQANGALMRISPLGIFGANADLTQVAEWAKQDAALTHPHLVCQQANALFAMAIAFTIRTGECAEEVYQHIVTWADEMGVNETLCNAITNAREAPPEDFTHQMGWVLIAFQNALYQLLHAESLEAGIVDTVIRGGDTDTNAAICGALLGAVYGRESIPNQWIKCIMSCRPIAGLKDVRRPRSGCFWPVDALVLAERVLRANSSN